MPLQAVPHRLPHRLHRLPHRLHRLPHLLHRLHRLQRLGWNPNSGRTKNFDLFLGIGQPKTDDGVLQQAPCTRMARGKQWLQRLGCLAFRTLYFLPSFTHTF